MVYFNPAWKFIDDFVFMRSSYPFMDAASKVEKLDLFTKIIFNQQYILYYE